MTQERPRNQRVLLMLSAAAFLSTPAVAQTAPDAQVAPAPQIAPEPQAAPVPAPVQVAPPVAAPVAEPAPAPVAAASDESATPVNPEAAAQAAAEESERTAERRQTRRAAPTREARAPVRSVERAAPVAAPVTAAPTAVQPEPATPAAAPVAAAPEPAAPAVAQSSNTTQTERGAAWWPFALIAALIVAAGVMLMRRRRAATEDAYVEPAYVEPARAEQVAVAEPVYVAPIAVDATVVRADGDDVEALTAAETHGERPWLEFAMRPVRAGTSADEALVEIELTVGNAGAVAAEDVRISTFMLSADQDGELERWLVEPRDDSVAPLTIAAGEGTRVDATLAMSRASLGEGSFRPVIVADARYRLPDGSEGRTSASFLVGGTTAGGAPAPIALDRRGLSEDVEAQLYRAPERV